MDIEFNCSCGNPDCKARAFFRRGYVHIRHEDGSEEQRWDYFYLDAEDWNEEEKKGQLVELMLPPSEARSLWWFLLWEFIPGFYHVCWFYRAYVKRMYFRIRLKRQ